MPTTKFMDILIRVRRKEEDEAVEKTKQAYENDEIEREEQAEKRKRLFDILTLEELAEQIVLYRDEGPIEVDVSITELETMTGELLFTGKVTFDATVVNFEIIRKIPANDTKYILANLLSVNAEDIVFIQGEDKDVYLH